MRKTHKSFPIVIVWESRPFSVGIIIEQVVKTHKFAPVVIVWEVVGFSVEIILERVVKTPSPLLLL
jgi:hypothetical protein